MSGYVAGTGIILGQGGGGNTSVTIDIDVEQINKNKTDIVTIKSNIANISTSEVTEGVNLYYTTDRFDTAFNGKDTGGLSEGTNLYYTTDRFDTGFSGKDAKYSLTGALIVDNLTEAVGWAIAKLI